MLFSALLIGCGPISLSGGEEEEAGEGNVVGTYELGWEINACRDDLPAEGTGHDVGDVLPQYEFLAQTGETVRLHDFCDQVVYMEIGYFT